MYNDILIKYFGSKININDNLIMYISKEGEPIPDGGDSSFVV